MLEETERIFTRTYEVVRMHDSTNNSSPERKSARTIF